VLLLVLLLLLLLITVLAALVCPYTNGGPRWCSSNRRLVLPIIVPSQVWAQIFAEGFCRCPHARHDS
jgi:hypothetical protein